MSFITWNTTAGNLGTVSENEYFEKYIDATDSGGATVFYRFLSGTLPPGVQVIRTGSIQGVPAVTSTTAADNTYTYSFVVRASTNTGIVSDRTFSLTISNIVAPILGPIGGKIAEIFDGTLYSFQFTAQDTSSSVLTFSLAAGTLPPGLSLSTSGLLSGFPTLIYRGDELGLTGYDASRHDRLGYDYQGLTQNQNYTFSIRVSDGLNADVKQYSLLVLSKSSWSADNAFNSVDDSYITTSWDNEYLPIMLTAPGSIGTVRQQDKFNFLFEAFDASNDTIAYAATTTTESGFDQNGIEGVSGIGFDTTEFDQGDQQLPVGLALNYLSGWMSGTAPAQVEATKIYSFKVTPYKLGRPGVTGRSVTYSLTVLGSEFNSVDWVTPTNLGIIDDGRPCTIQLEATSTLGRAIVYSLESGVPQQLPQGVRLTTDGLLIGRPTFRRFSVDIDYTIVTVEDSTGVEVGMSVTGPGVGTGAEVTELVGTTQIIINPAVVAAAGTALTFFSDNKTVILVTTQPNQTTTITDNGSTTFDGVREFTARATASSIVYDRFTGTGVRLSFTMSQAESANESVLVTVNGVRQRPTIDYQVSIKIITFTTVPSSNAMIVVIHDNTVSSTRTFNIRVSEYNLAPYENVYVKALPSLEQRQSFNSIISNSSVFPDDLLYRINDPWFGKAKDIKALLLPGIAPNSLSNYIAAMVRNHYNKNIRFGNIKTARAVDEFFNTKYEVVYIELVDSQKDQGRSIRQERIDLSTMVANYFNDDSAYRYLYPNSFNNMNNRLSGVLGFENRGALPDWMTSPQTDGRVLGFVPSVILAYTKPDQANTIKYRLEQSGFNFNSIAFTADRYQLDNVLSTNFDLGTNKFRSSSETTFDYVPRAGSTVATVNFACTTTFESINNRHIDYIANVNGGIDGATNFEDGDTLIFAQQENYAGNTKPYDGWIINKDSWTQEPFDTIGLDLYEVIPGYLAKITGFSTVNRRAGVWTIQITNSTVTLEFTQEILIGQRVRVGNGKNYGSSILVYDPLVKSTASVPAYTVLNSASNTSTQRTVFDGNGTKFINYRDIYSSPETGDKYLKFPQIGVFN